MRPSLFLYIIKGQSMEPTVRSGDILVISAFGRRTLVRGDLVVSNSSDAVGYVLKRVVGVPGETVKLSEGLLLIDDEHLVEPYLHGLPATVGLSDAIWNLKSNEYFLMGDNRAHSTDSRDYGPVDGSKIKGRSMLRCWPISRVGRVR